MYPVLYMNVDFWNRYFNGTDVASWCPLWVAEYGVSTPRVACEFWQYDENGMDKDVFFGTVDDLKERHTYK